MFPNLQYFHFDPFLCYHRISFWSSPSAGFSSTVCELRVKVMYTEDCLYLLDGRFNQLRTFFVNIGSLATHAALKINKGKLPNLRCFSLYYLLRTSFYDTIIIGQNEDECYIYSYPYKITRYENIEKNFPGHLFTCGFEESLFDEHSLEHDFFIQIVQSFPFMSSLTLTNREAQNDKQCRKLEK
ncbi:unnamed protein product [Rotaria socialis]|uniref:Uncharacterized protein n=1 Tax=Rotaria socialis TaxID=392032 RepID=A0A817YU01_9BILA|nr:unnamed protein product [Rotaria socialis]